MSDAIGTSYLGQAIDLLRGKRVLCVGDLMLDRFIYGDVERMSPEAPIPVLSQTEEEQMLGAVGNVARNVVALGGVATIISIVGDDEPAGHLKRLISENEGLHADLVTVSGLNSTVKTRYISRGQQLLRADVEDCVTLREEDENRLLDAIRSELGHADAVAISDYAKGCLSTRILRNLVDLANEHNLPLVADPKYRDLDRYNGVTILKPNVKELSEAFGLPCTDDETAEQLLKHAMSALRVGSIVLTRSDQGMSAIDGSGKVGHVRDRMTEVFDVSGAGDTAAALMSLALGAGLSTLDATKLANKACRIAVSKQGTAVVYADELAQAIATDQFRTTEQKIVSAHVASDLVKKWRLRNNRIGFTNGCFDLLHAGHVSLLAQAKSECDRLVVGLNTDASVKRLKGESRPINNETARSIVLASLADVDLVVLFNEDTPMSLIEELRPDVLVKGADYTVETVVGSDFVRSYGGTVKLAELEEGHSTTRTIHKIQM